MIGVDTNVIARLFVDDGSPERSKAIAFFETRGPTDIVFVSIIALVELIWLLTSRYGFKRSQTLSTLDALLGNAGFLLEEEALVIAALDNARATNSDLPDNLVAALGRKAGCEHTVTFDHDAAVRIPGMELLK